MERCLPTAAVDKRGIKARVLIWASGTPAASAAQKATASIPVVFALVGDPVYSKLVRSLAAPGANLTGMSLMISEMWEKRIRRRP
jgi:putative tryptophan/tyrosine transport system substrate-binding protein